MKANTILCACTIFIAFCACSSVNDSALIQDSGAISAWTPAGDHIRTEWAACVNPAAPLPEYPRPQLERNEWRSLNGLWDYAIGPGDGENMPDAEGKILVPFCVESSLSGVGRRLGPDEALWYRCSFNVPKAWKGKQVWLNFGAIDAYASLWINGKNVNIETTEYSSSQVNITSSLNAKGPQELVLKVTDPSDAEIHPRGKQVTDNGGIWYTPVSGIWQSVWLEPTEDEAHITTYSAMAEGIEGRMNLSATVEGAKEWDEVEFTLSRDGKKLASSNCSADGEASVKIDNPALWSPENPALYDLEIALVRDGKVIDRAGGYAAFREIKEITDSEGHKRMSLNGKPYFQFGLLDQGWWPDGLYTAPTDEALRYDIEETKALGYNMIRKHVKVEPDRWYYWADKLGIIVWQDMPSITGSEYGRWEMWNWVSPEDDATYNPYAKGRSGSAAENYEKPWKNIVLRHNVFPCIAVWVPFNEGWGQFDTPKYVALTKEWSPARLVNSASGGNSLRGVGDIFDSHNYPDPRMKFWSDGAQIDVLGEFGGIGCPLEGHLWNPEGNWGYIRYKSGEEVLKQYAFYAQMLKETIAQGCAAAVYTQTTDVESEVNGLMTYDRAIVKMNADSLRAINLDVIEFANEIQ